MAEREIGSGKASASCWVETLSFRQAQDPELAEGLEATNAARADFSPVAVRCAALSLPRRCPCSYAPRCTPARPPCEETQSGCTIGSRISRNGIRQRVNSSIFGSRYRLPGSALTARAVTGLPGSARRRRCQGTGRSFQGLRCIGCCGARSRRYRCFR